LNDISWTLIMKFGTDITWPLTKLHGCVVGTLASYLWLYVLYTQQSKVASIHPMKAYEGVEAQLRSFLTSTRWR